MKTEQEKQIELISEITLLSQLINYRLDELQPCIFKNKTKVLFTNLREQSVKLDKVINPFTTRLEGNEDLYTKAVGYIDKAIKQIHKR
jgi:hypothetical protein